MCGVPYRSSAGDRESESFGAVSGGTAAGFVRGTAARDSMRAAEDESRSGNNGDVTVGAGTTAVHDFTTRGTARHAAMDTINSPRKPTIARRASFRVSFLRSARWRIAHQPSFELFRPRHRHRHHRLCADQARHHVSKCCA